MHQFDVNDLARILITYLIGAFPFIKGTLDTTKQAADTVESVQKLLPLIHRAPHETPSDDEPDLTPDEASERVYAASHLIRSYALFGFLEATVWITKLTFSYLLISKWIGYMERKYTQKP